MGGHWGEQIHDREVEKTEKKLSSKDAVERGRNGD